ncbi:MAG: SDR family oxidoreductase [Sphingobium sp.]|nr:SDR family oxidoreductase [Sphingobium sp.]MBP9157605.1 SDR family oxidoreductase [Sphingobium sp.]
MIDDPDQSGQAVCIVTGAASGIGEATARLFAAKGYQVIVADIQVERGEAVAASLGADAQFHRLDVLSEDNFSETISAVAAQFGRLDCLVNNAAITGAMGPLAGLSAEDFGLAVDIIYRSVFFGCKHAARIMQPQRRGSIVNIASISGKTAGYSPHFYAACKAAVIQFTKSIALELIEDGVRVNAVCPGNVETPILTGIRDDRWRQRIERIGSEMKDMQAIGRLARPAELAEAIYWLASDASSFVTGHDLVADGGLLAGRPWRLQPEHFRNYHEAKF